MESLTERWIGTCFSASVVEDPSSEGRKKSVIPLGDSTLLRSHRFDIEQRDLLKERFEAVHRFLFGVSGATREGCMT